MVERSGVPVSEPPLSKLVTVVGSKRRNRPSGYDKRQLKDISEKFRPLIRTRNSGGGQDSVAQSSFVSEKHNNKKRGKSFCSEGT